MYESDVTEGVILWLSLCMHAFCWWCLLACLLVFTALGECTFWSHTLSSSFYFSGSILSPDSNPSVSSHGQCRRDWIPEQGPPGSHRESVIVWSSLFVLPYCSLWCRLLIFRVFKIGEWLIGKKKLSLDYTDHFYKNLCMWWIFKDFLLARG